MRKTNAKAQRSQDIEALLPWHAAGTLGRRDAERVEQALTNDKELKREYDMVREELGETIRLNERLGAPSARVMERLMAAIEADGAAPRKNRTFFNIGAWISVQLAQLSPRTLARSATAAALAIVLQAGIIAGLYVKTADKGGKGIETPSYEKPNGPVTRQGSYVLVRFTPDATANDITNFLEAYKVAVVEAPQAKDLFRLRVAETSRSKAEIAQIVAHMQADNKIITFIAPIDK
jgi:hypothetical protein